VENTYWNENGKHQAFLDQASEKMPSIGYTGNPYMNMFIAMSHIYYDAYNNGGCNIEDHYMRDFRRYVHPMLPDLSVSDFISGREVLMEAAMDRVLEFLKDKPMDFPAYKVWFSYEDKCLSHMEPGEEDPRVWSVLSFGELAERNKWCSEQESFNKVKDVTQQIVARNRPRNGQKGQHFLPEMCYSVAPATGELIMLRNGESGYWQCKYNTESRESNRGLAAHLNSLLGVTQAQVLAMEFGSMFGWDKPGADPSIYVKQPLSEKIAEAENKKNHPENGQDKVVPTLQR